MTELFMTGAAPEEIWPLVRDFHYSRKLPSNIQHAFAWRGSGGLFGDFGEPKAALIYGVPVNRNWPSDALELQRLVRHDEFDQPLSAFVSWSLRWLRGNTPTPFVLSYADTGQEHHGGIYQACGFTYVAESQANVGHYYDDGNGALIHSRAIFRQFGTTKRVDIAKLRPAWSPSAGHVKHLYIKPLRQRLSALLKRFDWTPLPFPKPDYANRPADEQATSLSEPEASSGVRSNKRAAA